MIAYDSKDELVWIFYLYPLDENSFTIKPAKGIEYLYFSYLGYFGTYVWEYLKVHDVFREFKSNHLYVASDVYGLMMVYNFYWESDTEDL